MDELFVLLVVAGLVAFVGGGLWLETKMAGRGSLFGRFGARGCIATIAVVIVVLTLLGDWGL